MHFKDLHVLLSSSYSQVILRTFRSAPFDCNLVIVLFFFFFFFFFKVASFSLKGNNLFIFFLSFTATSRLIFTSLLVRRVSVNVIVRWLWISRFSSSQLISNQQRKSFYRLYLVFLQRLVLFWVSALCLCHYFRLYFVLIAFWSSLNSRVFHHHKMFFVIILDPPGPVRHCLFQETWNIRVFEETSIAF